MTLVPIALVLTCALLLGGCATSAPQGSPVAETDNPTGASVGLTDCQVVSEVSNAQGVEAGRTTLEEAANDAFTSLGLIETGDIIETHARGASLVRAGEEVATVSVNEQDGRFYAQVIRACAA